METIVKKLNEIQKALKAPKNQKNNFGNYMYRNAEDILEAAKPLVHSKDCVITVDEEVFEIAGKLCMKSTAKLTDGKEFVSCVGLAFIDLNKKGMSSEQATGAASSYAKKYALGNLFAIDDTKDADSTNTHGKGESSANALKKPSNDKPTLNTKHTNWNQVLNALQTGKRSVEQLKESFQFDEKTYKILKTHEKLG